MSEIDPELSAKWRAASDEQPPAALDNAIRAAARREVGAKPGGFRATPRWLPLAVAATVAAVAVGIVQMTPPEQVAPAAFPASTDAARRDVKPDAGNAMENGQKRDMAAAAPAVTQRDMIREEAKPAAKEQRSRATHEKTPGAGARVGGFAAAPDAALQEKRAVPQAQRAEKEDERDQASKQKAELAAASSVSRQNSGAASAPAPSAPRNELQPFPAAPVPAETALANAPKSMADAVPPPPPASSPAPAPAAQVAARKLAAQSSSAGAASGSIASNGVDTSASKDAGNAEPERARSAAALGKTAPAEADKAAPERRKDSAPLAPDEWIKRIRRLIAEGRNEDAAKELIAFRHEYKERSDALLPGDLRAFRP